MPKKKHSSVAKDSDLFERFNENRALRFLSATDGQHRFVVRHLTKPDIAEFAQEIRKTIEEETERLEPGDSVTLQINTSEVKLSAFLADALMPVDRAGDLFIQLSDAYETRWLPRYGERKAKQIFYMQMTGAVFGFWIGWVLGRLNLYKVLFGRSGST